MSRVGRSRSCVHGGGAHATLLAVVAGSAGGGGGKGREGGEAGRRRMGARKVLGGDGRISGEDGSESLLVGRERIEGG